MPQPRVHIPVLLEEVIEWLQPMPGGTYVDGTLGAGGHTRALAERVGKDGVVISLDQDPEAIAAAEQNLAGLPIVLVHSNFADLPEVLRQVQVDRVDGVLLDLGFSSDQLAAEERGLSFESEGTLDMRYNPEEGEPAWRMLERISIDDLADLLYEYAEERFSRRIARAIVDRRRRQPVRTARELAEVIHQAVGYKRRDDRIDPATRTFQALRMAVNAEPESLQAALRRVPDCLESGGRFAVISFHSLEDRPVKQAFREDTRLEVLTKKPIRPSEAEIARNSRARSAKLRVAAKV